MAIAGRAAIVPKGEWSANATYKRLDAVTYNNTLYFAKKEVPAGTATSNTEYWSKSIVGGASAIATTEDAGVVKPDGKSMSVDESGTLSINLDGTTITLDEAKNVIKLADTLKEKINGAFPATNVVNNQTTTEEGFALDARQANPSIAGTLAKMLSDVNGNLNTAFYALKEVKDANDAEPGFARIAVGTSNHNPFPNFWTILLTVPFVELSGGYAIQIGMSISAAQYNGKLAIRIKDGNNWGAWAILSDINDVNNVIIKDVSDKLDTSHMTGSIAYATFGRVTMVWFDVMPVTKADNTTILPTGTIPKAYGYAYHSINTWGQNNVPDSLMAVRDDGSLGFWAAQESVDNRIFDSFIYFSKP